MTSERPPVRPTRAEIDLRAVTDNTRLLLDAADGAELCAVVKADGYGHGAVEVARAALAGGATWLAVALVEEGEQLRAAGIEAPVLVLSEPPPDAAERLVDARLTPSVYTVEFAGALAAVGAARGRPVAAHAEIDTGMARTGVPVADWPRMAARLAGLDGLEITGVWTHLARADEPDADDVTTAQLDSFSDALGAARDAGLEPDWVHVGNSAADLRLDHPGVDLVRTGIALYGLSPGPAVRADEAGLRPALRLVSEVAYTRHVRAGTPVSYGHTWRAPADGVLATVPVGYADGVPRLLSNRADVLIGGRRRPIAGTVCMDQLMVWCGADGVAVGDGVVLLGAQGDERIVADEWAEAAGTITYEIATGLTARVPRTYLRPS